MAKRKKSKKSRNAAAGQARAAGMASTTFGRSRKFKNRKKDAAKKACRKPVEH